MQHQNKKNLVVFDMDGVLIDVSQSYRDAVRETAALFFRPAKAWEKLPRPLFALSDLANLKQSGGLNNDWDLTCLVISLLYSVIPSAPGKPIKPETDAEAWERYLSMIAKIDVSPLASYLKSHESPLTNLFSEKGKPVHAFIGSLYQKDVGQGNIIKQIFQEIYLGPNLFKRMYGLETRVWHDPGFIQRESVLIEPAILKRLARDHTLAIATGRPAAEAEIPLRQFNLGTYFDMVYTLDDCLREERAIFEREGRRVSLSKPSPFMLNAISSALPAKRGRCYYIGDMPDDMIAAARADAGFKGVGAVYSSPDKSRLKAELERNGARCVVERAEDLLEVIG